MLKFVNFGLKQRIVWPMAFVVMFLVASITGLLLWGEYKALTTISENVATHSDQLQEQQRDQLKGVEKKQVAAASS